MQRVLNALRFADHSLTTKLGAICLLMAASVLAVYGAAVRTIPSQVVMSAESLKLGEAQRINQHADMLHDSLHADLLRALLKDRVGSPSLDRDPSTSLMHHVDAFRRDLTSLQQLQLPQELGGLRSQTVVAGRHYVNRVEQIYNLSLTNRQAALNALPEFDAAFAAAEHHMAEFTGRLSAFIQEAHGSAMGQYEEARQWVTYAGVLAVVIGWAGVAAISRSIRRSLRSLCEVARDIASGQLDRRSHHVGSDEIGQLASSVDRMAASLQNMIQRVSREAELAAFGATLARALDMASDENETCAVVTEAMELAAPRQAMELLLADPNGHHFVRAAAHPSAGAPGCGVSTGHDCVAVRRAQPLSFPDSRAIDACPRIRTREGKPVCATCIPVTFTGRAVGVLHTTSALAEPMQETVVSRLSTLARLAGSRIGTLRAFQQSEHQASTDALTGLPNRRSTEAWIRDALRCQRTFTLLICDIDHFKNLNDTHGHLAGDEALRCFAGVARQQARKADLVGRWGGDEFVCLLDGQDGQGAAVWAEQLQSELDRTIQADGMPPFTISLGIVESRWAEAPDALLQLGDKALYRAKTNGRNRSELVGATRDSAQAPLAAPAGATAGLKMVFGQGVPKPRVTL